jgi:hypothetical protein
MFINSEARFHGHIIAKYITIKKIKANFHKNRYKSTNQKMNQGC